MSGLTCPKCQGDMRSYERNGVTIDQCSSCRGIFLDRGELERLIDAESAWNSANAAPPPPSRDARSYGERDDHRRDRRPSYDSDDDHRGGHYGGKRKKSFLQQLLD